MEYVSYLPLFCPLLVWFGVKLKDLMEASTVTRAEEPAGSKERGQPNPRHKQQENEHQWSRVYRQGQPVGWHRCQTTFQHSTEPSPEPAKLVGKEIHLLGSEGFHS